MKICAVGPDLFDARCKQLINAEITYANANRCGLNTVFVVVRARKNSIALHGGICAFWAQTYRSYICYCCMYEILLNCDLKSVLRCR